MSTELSVQLKHFLDSIELDAILLGIPESERVEAKATYQTFANEAQVALSLIENELNFDQEILEVGAGLCLLSLFLKQQGYSITALEPLAGGFGFFERLKQGILQHKTDIRLPLITTPVEQITPTAGSFDLIFSNNVVEHILPLPEAMQAMKSVLNENGKMIHGCPNYFVPYEPHFGLPVFSFMPQLTAWIWRKRIASNIDVWQSLNFVTYRQIKKLSKTINCSVRFEPSLTYRSFKRLQDDSEFQQRHEGSFAAKCLRLLDVTGTLKLTRYLPAWASTPMIFSLTHKNTTL